MSGDRVIVLDGGEVLLGGGYVGALATALERAILHAESHNGGGGALWLRPLLNGLRDASARGSAAQPAEPHAVIDAPWWPATDEINVEEAAEIMGCSQSNIRKRCRRETLAALKVGGEWVLSREGVSAAAAHRGVA